MSFNARMLEGLTLEAIKAKSIAHNIRLGEAKSHFNPDVSAIARLAVLGEYASEIFHYGAVVPDLPKLQDALLELAAVAAIWAEKLDVPNNFTEGMAKLREGGIVRPVCGYHQEGSLPNDIPAA